MYCYCFTSIIVAEISVVCRILNDLLFSDALVNGGITTYIAGMMLLMSFASPYWIQSFQETMSKFKHMGLWEYCFEEFRFPNYQVPKLFNGCHYIFSQEYNVMREWLLPRKFKFLI